jgi:hypothetical protein
MPVLETKVSTLQILIPETNDAHHGRILWTSPLLQQLPLKKLLEVLKGTALALNNFMADVRTFIFCSRDIPTNENGVCCIILRNLCHLPWTLHPLHLNSPLNILVK